LIGITDPMLNMSSMFYDGAGRVVTKTDPIGHTIKYQYNNLNQLTQLTDPLQGITTLSYDLNGNLKTVQDARQQGTNYKTVYTYDNFDHLQTRSDPLTRQETYVFDQLGNLTSFTDRRGKVSTYQYDGINRRTFAGYGTLPGPTYESTVNYTYDGGNRLSKVVDSTSGTITPVFDGLDRITSETTPQGSVAYTYRKDNLLKTATVTGQPTVNYYYDNARRLYKVAQGTTNTLIGYDNANRRKSLTLPNGIVLTYGYDNDSRINSMSYQLGTTAVGSLTYQYDAVGRRTQMGGSLAATGFPQAVGSAAYDVANELTNWNGTTITPDANGNVLNDGVAAYTWNARNQLISRGSTSFQYDSYGRRTLNAAGNNLLYEGPNVGQELSGTTPVANRILGGIDEFFSRADSSAASSPITDALGSILALTNSSGNTTVQYGYDPFGNTTSSGGTSTNVFQYTGRENDGNGLYFYRARYYNPVFGRFISEDPIGFGGGINVYAYVGNSPTNLIDAFGLRPGDRYPTLRCAGWNAVRDINQTSRQRSAAWPNGREYGGWAYQNPDGTYSYTAPAPGEATGMSSGDYNPNPVGTTKAADYHTHGAYMPSMNPGNPSPGAPGYKWRDDGNEVFSPPDMDSNDRWGLPGFLGTPQGTTEMYVPIPGRPEGGSVTVLNGRNCGCN
jgi:RHS repeat-associated protein